MSSFSSIARKMLCVPFPRLSKATQHSCSEPTVKYWSNRIEKQRETQRKGMTQGKEREKEDKKTGETWRLSLYSTVI